jgi:hypothetical protein
MRILLPKDPAALSPEYVNGLRRWPIGSEPLVAGVHTIEIRQQHPRGIPLAPR